MCAVPSHLAPLLNPKSPIGTNDWRNAQHPCLRFQLKERESTEEGDPSWGATDLSVSWSPTPSHWLFSLRFLIYKRSDLTSYFIQCFSVVSSTPKNLLWTISYSSPSICLLATTQLSSQVFISWLKCYDYFKICLYSCKNYSQHWLPFLFKDVEFESSSDSGLSVESSEISSELAVFPHHVIGFFLPLGSVELVPIQLPSYPSSESISSYHQVQTKHRLIKWSLPPPSTPSVLLPGWNAMP